MPKIRKSKSLISNRKAVMGMPLRLTVCLVIGSAALIFILSFILNPCIFPGKMTVNVSPMVNSITGGSDHKTFTITVEVSDSSGYKIKDATIIIKGLGAAASGTTDSNGICDVSITPYLSTSVYEGYLDLTVKASCMETFSQNKMIKIIREP